MEAVEWEAITHHVPHFPRRWRDGEHTDDVGILLDTVERLAELWDCPSVLHKVAVMRQADRDIAVFLDLLEASDLVWRQTALGLCERWEGTIPELVITVDEILAR